MDGDHADDLLRRALIDAEAAASVALRVTPLVLSEALTVVFHGRKDLGTIQTYVAHGGRGAGDAVGKDELMRVPCDLDLAAAEDRAEAEHLFAEQAGALRDALVGADTVLDIWREPLEDLAQDRIRVDRRINLNVRLPAHRLLPTALVAPEKQIVVTAVCSARPLAEGRPPMGIACAQQDVVRVYPLPDDPERCLNDFLELAADHARSMAEQIGRQEASVQRFLELSGEDFPRLDTPARLPLSALAADPDPHRRRLRRLRLPRHLGDAGPRAERDRHRAFARGRGRAAPRRKGTHRRVLRHTPACAQEPACVAATDAFVAQADAARRRRDPPVPPVGADAGDERGRHRPRGLARRRRRPVVQCVRVRREGPLSGAGVELLAISAPIGNEAALSRVTASLRRALC